MREGLRSGKLSLNPRRDGKDNVSPSKIVQNGMKVSGSDLSCEGNLHLISSRVETEKQSSTLEIEQNEEEYVEDGEDVALVENERKRSLNGGEESEYGGVVKKMVKEEEVLDDEVPTVGRVLRSRLAVKSGADDGGGKGDSESSFIGKGMVSDVYENKMVKVEKEDNDQQVGGMMKLKKKRGRPPKVRKEETDLQAGGLEMNLKRKRGRPLGRPPKVKKEEIDLKVDALEMNLKRKRGRPLGRPPKAGKEEVNLLVGRSKKLKRGRGRPRKWKDGNGVLKAALDKEGKLGGSWKGEKDLKLRDSVNWNASTASVYAEKRHNGKELNMKRFSPAKKNKCGQDLEIEDKASIKLKSKIVQESSVNKENKGEKAKQEDEEVEPGRFAAKQLVREKITELLISAGWTVQYRPRFNRCYNDAVYVSPDGKTHWSVTLAYRVLKQRYEAGDGESMTYKAGFVFTPISEEEFGILKRVVSKKRVGKRKRQQKHEYGDKIGAIEKKRHKAGASLGGKSVKRRMKGKLLYEQDDSAGTSQEVMPISIRDHKVRKTQSKKRCALLVRNNEEGVDLDVDGYIPYDGKRTVFSWMIDLGTVPLNGKVQYMNQRRTRIRLGGRITRDGIHCDCCSEVIPIAKFEAHAGSNLCQPFQNIFVETGTSLLQCLLDSWNKQEKSECKGFHFVDVDGEDPNDDTCGICGDGGDLICCDTCPSTFHQSCLDIEKFPFGDWHCVYCSCKICGMVDGNAHQRHDDDVAAVFALLTCQLCEEKFHQSCIQEKDAVNIDSNGPSFCGKKCQKLFERLHMLHGVKHELEVGFSWTLIRRSDISPTELTPEVEWNSKLAVAFSIMDECFLPVIDHRSGVNLIHNIVYNCGSNFTRLNYSGFFTVILERGDEIISVASIRIHGNQLAEMPFIGTRYMYRRQGMFRRLLGAIESVLCSLNVEKLVIPAISELRGTWTSIFGFKPLDLSSKQKMRSMNMLVFPGIDMLQKSLLKHQFDEENLASTQGLVSTEHTVAHNSNLIHSAGSDLNVSIGPAVAHVHDLNQPAAVESGLHLPGRSGDMTGETTDLPKCVIGQKCQVQVQLSDNNQEEDRTVMKPLDSICNANGPTEGIAAGSVITTLDGRTTEHDSLADHNCISEVEGKLFMVPLSGFETSNCEKPCVSASGMDAENADCEMKTEDSIVQRKLNSYEETSQCHPAEYIMSQCRDVACVDRLKISTENVLYNLGAATRMSHDVKDIKPDGFQQLQDMGCVLESDERMLNTQEGKNSHSAVLCTSRALYGICPTSTEHSGSQVQPKTKNIFCNKAILTIPPVHMVHPTLPSVHQREQTNTSGFPVESNVSPSCQGNRPDAHEVEISAAVEGKCHFSSEASLNSTMKPNIQTCMSNGVCMALEVRCGSSEVTADGPREERESSAINQTNVNSTDQDLILDGPEVKNKSSEKVDHICVTKCNPKSSELSKSDSSITQCNSESMCNLSSASDVALHCASSGGNSCGTPEIMVLSNRAS
ncbi:hypothetical protein I3842_07G092600 [Carya illinoinensis]|uniref:PHD-type domain-containing protein n=1 Tax=Carya illinoinensis TaxID=32201 RepID=A0A922EH42_CARIL|nr:hypothetical protein I3842_07G092600 [Carya illinoinensis]KAG6703606.1 hypothetical protein I3842_07G092600 [Carya illinoinensis]